MELSFPKSFLIVSLLILCNDKFLGSSHGAGTFTNPIFPGDSPDPGVFFDKNTGFYYLSLSTNTNTQRSLTLYKSRTLTSFYPEDSESQVIYTLPEGFRDVWASELHEVEVDGQNELFVYFTMKNITEDFHRMYVMKARDRANPMGEYEEPIKLMEEFDQTSYIDGTLMRTTDGGLYIIWSSRACLYIAKMDGPTKVIPSFVQLRRPTADWECKANAAGGTLCMSEGPYVIYNKGVGYLIFSSSETFSPHYNLGMMSIPLDRNPMTPSNWDYRGTNGPVFQRNDEENVFMTGHASFTVSPDGTETWMAYHATNSSTILNPRVARIEKIDWAETGEPVFPKPKGYNHPQPVPSGQE